MSIFQSLRQTLRSLRGSPGLIAVCALSIGLGLGLNATLFSFIHATLLRPAPVHDPASLHNLYSVNTTTGELGPVSVPDYQDFKRDLRSFESLTGYSQGLFTVEPEGAVDPTMEIGAIVLDDYFETLGISAQAGRLLGPEDHRRGAQPAVVITDSYWHRQFKGQSVRGETLRIGGELFDVVGVLPRDFTGLMRGLIPQMFVSISAIDHVEPMGQIESQGKRTEDHLVDWRGFRFLTLTGRLAPNQDAGSARAEFETAMARHAEQYKESNERLGATTVPLEEIRIHPGIDRFVLPAAALLLGLCGLVLVIACANLANILIARAQTRRREMAVRLALGASRKRIMAQLFGESLVLSVFGLAVGLALAFFATRVLSKVEIGLPIHLFPDLRLDAAVLAFAAALAVLTALLFGMIPALQSAQTDVFSAIKSKHDSDARKRSRLISLRSALLAVQVAVCLALLMGAGLFLEGLRSNRLIETGFDAEQLGVLTVNFERLGVEGEALEQRTQNLLNRLASVAGVERVSEAARLPLSLNFWQTSLFLPRDAGNEDARGIVADNSVVGNEYFETLGLELLEGRLFDARDRPDTERVAVISQALQERLWPGESALGKRVRTRTNDGREHEIVGVVRDYKIRTPGEAARPIFHTASRQSPNEFTNLIYKTTSGPAEPLLESVRRELSRVEPNVIVMDATTVSKMREMILLPVRMGMVLMALMGALALVLAAIGLSGVIAYWVSKRRKELGLRMALGATSGAVVALALRQVLPAVLGGAVIGTLLGFLVSKGAQQAFFIPGAGPVVLAGAILVMALIAGAAALVPAVRATRVDPMIALRDD